MANLLCGHQIKPVQKQTRAGQRTRFKAIVVIGDSEGHVGLGIKTSKEVATAIRAAIIIAKLSVLPIRRGYWGTSLGDPHSLPTKESGKCGSVTVRVCLCPYLSLSCLGTDLSAAHSCSSWYRSCRLPCCQAPPPTRWRTRCLYLLFRLYQNTREYLEGYICSRGQYIWFLDAESVERHEAQSKPIGGVWGCAEGGKEVLRTCSLSRS